MIPTSSIPQLAISDRQDLYSMAYVRAIVVTAGFNFSKEEVDRNSADLHIEHILPDGFAPIYQRLSIQVKCTYAHGINSDGTIHYPLPVRNYNHLRRLDIGPRILVVVLVPRPDLHTTEPWIEHQNNYTIFRYQAYWLSLMGASSTNNDDAVTVKIPTKNLFNVKAVYDLMDNMVAQGNKKWSG